jgi:sodium/hydrogen antiporter
MPDPYILMLFVVGALVALVAWLPLLFRRAPLSLPIVCLILGAGLFTLPQAGFDPLPQTYPDITERLTEFVVIVALMGAGLKIDRIFNLRRWGVTWRLLGVTMMLSVVAIVVLGWTVLGLGLAERDPACRHAGPDGSRAGVRYPGWRAARRGEDEVRFGLTSEAGLNDGLAFPFVNLAIALALAASGQKDDWFVDWLTVNVLWEIGAGLAYRLG